jgi:hypothetical protein
LTGGVTKACDRKHGCHWDYVRGPNRGTAAPRTMVWICEYPYRTVRLDGPCDDCECFSGTIEKNRRYFGDDGVVLRRSKCEGGRVLPFRDNR